jgi:hypothetical protein
LYTRFPIPFIRFPSVRMFAISFQNLNLPIPIPLEPELPLNSKLFKKILSNCRSGSGSH